MPAVSNRRDRGVTLVELMISMALMGLVVAIVAATLGLAQRTTNRIESSSNAIDAARLVSATLDRELRSAVCIKEPVPNQPAPRNVLTFQTAASPGAGITYEIVDDTVTRTENGATRTVVEHVGATTTAFQQLMTPLRTVVVDIPIRSDNGGEFHLQTTVAGRNAWGQC
jgi:prepilin-type N-terminal cleavage/methylation domain-containing protein